MVSTSRMQQIAAKIVATPGLRLSDIALSLGMTSSMQRNRISATLHSLARAGKIKHNNRPGRSGQRRW